jgi:hypothetical protein
MLTSFAKNFKGRASASAISSAQDSTIDSNNDANIRPVHIINEDKSDNAENRQIDHQNGVIPVAFDEASLSTHGSVYQVPVKTVYICDKEGKVLLGNDANRDDEDDPTMEEENKEGLQTGKKDQFLQNTISHRRDDNIELSFHVDGSMLDGSVLDRALENFRYTTSPPDSGTKNSNWKELNDSNNDYEHDDDDDDNELFFHKTKGSPNLVQEEVTYSNECDENLENSAFAEIGKLMFIQQPDTHNSKSSSSIVSSPTTHSNRLDEKTAEHSKRIGGITTTISNLVMLLKLVTAFFTVYGVRAFWFNLTTYVLDAAEIEKAFDDSCSEESFHFAMYQLSALNADKNPIEDVSSVHESTRVGSFLTVTATVLTYHFIGYILNKIWPYAADGKTMTKMADSVHMHHSTMNTPKKEPKLVRELNSLDKKKVFASTFVTEVISPDGSISSIKRSTRVKNVCLSQAEDTLDPVQETRAIKVDLFSKIKAEPKWKNDGMRMKIKAEKI